MRAGGQADSRKRSQANTGQQKKSNVFKLMEGDCSQIVIPKGGVPVELLLVRELGLVDGTGRVVSGSQRDGRVCGYGNSCRGRGR